MKKPRPPWMLDRQLLVKAEETTDPQYGCSPEERPLVDYVRSGIINLDKTSGPSSHEVTAWVKRILKISRAGHGGTLET
jgi:H/ACA ribonucleoprotein complex subunit 4